MRSPGSRSEIDKAQFTPFPQDPPPQFPVAGYSDAVTGIKLFRKSKFNEELNNRCRLVGRPERHTTKVVDIGS